MRLAKGGGLAAMVRAWVDSCGRTFEQGCLRTQVALGRGGQDATGAWSGQARAAVAGQPERGVRPHWLRCERVGGIRPTACS